MINEPRFPKFALLSCCFAEPMPSRHILMAQEEALQKMIKDYAREVRRALAGRKDTCHENGFSVTA